MTENDSTLPQRVLFSVVGNPLPKARPRIVNGHAYTPARTCAWEQQIAYAYQEAGGQLLAGPLAIYLWFYRGDRRACDLDNLVKAVFDGLNGVAWQDDAQIVALHAYKTYDQAQPRVAVIIEPRAISS